MRKPNEILEEKDKIYLENKPTEMLKNSQTDQLHHTYSVIQYMRATTHMRKQGQHYPYLHTIVHNMCTCNGFHTAPIDITSVCLKE